MKTKERLAELTEKYHLTKNEEGIFVIQIKDKKFEIKDFSEFKNLGFVKPHILFREELLERLKRIDIKFDYIFKDPDFQSEKKERQEFLLDDFNFSIFEALKSMKYLFDIIDFGKSNDFHYLFPKKPFDILKMFIDLLDCVDYAIFQGLIELNNQIQEDKLNIVVIDPETNEKLDLDDQIIKEIKNIIYSFKTEIFHPKEKEENKIDLNAINPKYMGRA